MTKKKEETTPAVNNVTGRPVLPPWPRVAVQTVQMAAIVGIVWILAGVLVKLVPDSVADGGLFEYTVGATKDIILVLTGIGGGAGATVGAMHLAKTPRRRPQK